MGRPPPERGPDHPRIRGEHPSECDEGHIVTGSSPHTRGARFAVIGVPFSLGIIPAYAGSTKKSRIIPAYAGSTPPSLRTTTVPPDHPRIRGEHRDFARAWL